MDRIAMSREEKLARSLISLYGMSVSVMKCNSALEHFSIITIKRKFDKCNREAKYHDWKDVLFSKVMHDKRYGRIKYNYSLNDAIRETYFGYGQRNIGLLEYSSLDELELQLALIGLLDK